MYLTNLILKICLCLTFIVSAACSNTKHTLPLPRPNHQKKNNYLPITISSIGSYSAICIGDNNTIHIKTVTTDQTNQEVKGSSKGIEDAQKLIDEALQKLDETIKDKINDAIKELDKTIKEIIDQRVALIIDNAKQSILDANNTEIHGLVLKQIRSLDQQLKKTIRTRVQDESKTLTDLAKKLSEELERRHQEQRDIRNRGDIRKRNGRKGVLGETNES